MMSVIMTLSTDVGIGWVKNIGGWAVISYIAVSNEDN